MLIKETGDKVNFIDKNDNFVGFDMQRVCCEQFGWYITDSITEFEPEQESNSEGFWFDTSVEPMYVVGDFDSGGSVAFKLVNENGNILYLHLFNDHNGYYSHGWETSFGCEGYL